MTAIDIACRRCTAQPGEPCTLNPDALPQDYGAGMFHAERIEDAAAMTRVSDPAGEMQFERAVANKLY